jgi:Fe(3+) dicitrate transport protein
MGEPSMISLLLFFSMAHAQETATLSPIRVIGSEAQELNKPNSSIFIPKEKLQRQQDSDLNKVIKSVPGVYVREEDGYGLRPNIGLRGTNPDRSKKVNIMEDGILIGPAPYSAPAAYYTPNMMHIEGVEVFKGVATVPYGPNSVAGTINLLTPDYKSGGFVDGSLGSYDYRKIIGRIGRDGDVYSYLFQAGYHETSGFKELPGDRDTGFKQADFLLKSRTRLRGGDRPQFLDIKLQAANEDSNESYLGIAKEDFNDRPFQRYAASALDEMKWHHETYQASYTAALTGNSTLVVTGYWHQFMRTWYRLDKFNSTTTLRQVLNDPTTFQDQYKILRGEEDSASIGSNGNLDIARNHRVFFSRGIEAHHMVSTGLHELHWGLRLHEDQIRHNHGLDRYAMTNGQMVRTTDPRMESLLDRDTSWSQSLFAKDEINLDPVRVTLAARYERVNSDARKFVVNDVPSDSSIQNKDDFFVPGIGAVYSLTPTTSLFAGLNKGYAPVGPGQADAIKPEESTNYELGVRYLKDFFFETIGFYNDYRNIKGLCSFSTGCTSGAQTDEFNGGQATVFGVESRLRFDAFYHKWKFPFELNYTYTRARFDSQFTTSSEEWGAGTIRKGAPLPYVPENQYTASLGVERGKVVSDVRFSWTGKQYDQSVEANRLTVPAYGVIDANVKYMTGKDSFAYLKIDNLLANDYIVSYRPYGLRPGKAQAFQVGFKQSF